MTKENIKFAPVPISKISCGIVLPADIYLFISGKYIKFKERGDQISVEKYHFFLAKNLKQVYIAFSELTLFMEWVKRIRLMSIDESVAEIGEKHRYIAEQREDIKEKLYETLADKEISSESVAQLRSSVGAFISDIQQLEAPKQILLALIKHNSSIAEHSANVANIAIFMALVLGVGRKSQLEHIYTGSLLHDYGKAKIPENILANQNDAKYLREMQQHPVKGAEMLKKAENIPAQVIRIVKEHHEQFNGQGYPDGLNGKQVYELSKIVAMANVYDEELQKYKNSGSNAYVKVAKFISLDHGKRFSSAQAKAVAEAILFYYDAKELPLSNI